MIALQQNLQDLGPIILIRSKGHENPGDQISQDARTKGQNQNDGSQADKGGVNVEVFAKSTAYAPQFFIESGAV